MIRYMIDLTIFQQEPETSAQRGTAEGWWANLHLSELRMPPKHLEWTNQFLKLTKIILTYNPSLKLLMESWGGLSIRPFRNALFIQWSDLKAPRSYQRITLLNQMVHQMAVHIERQAHFMFSLLSFSAHGRSDIDTPKMVKLKQLQLTLCYFNIHIFWWSPNISITSMNEWSL